MNILQRALIRISGRTPEDEEEKTREYEERRQRRLITVRAEVDAEIEVPDADDLGRWFGFEVPEEGGGDGDDAP